MTNAKNLTVGERLITQALIGKPLGTAEIQRATQLMYPSHHLKTLVALGLIRQTGDQFRLLQE